MLRRLKMVSYSICYVLAECMVFLSISSIHAAFEMEFHCSMRSYFNAPLDNSLPTISSNSSPSSSRVRYRKLLR